jgi:hypothetical protein
MWISFFVLFGCNRSSWSNADDCMGLEMGVEKDNCWSVYIFQVFESDPQKGIEIVQKEISEEKVKDFLWLEITREVDPTTMTYCKQIKNKSIFERCKLLVSRPHLHRDTLRKNNNSGGVPSSKPQ